MMTAVTTDNWVLAIDGGGTHCDFALARRADAADPDSAAHGNRRWVHKGGPANATSDFNATVSCIEQGLAALSTKASVPVEVIHTLPAYVGLAGVTGQDIATRLKSALPLQHAHFEEDRNAALRGALGDKDGLVAHCGTGSFFAARIDGSIRFAGGWGSILGDEASAQWVGRLALADTLQHCDGFVTATPLITRLLDQFGSAAAIVDFASRATPRDFGDLAPIVTSSASDNDPTAQRIMQSAATYLSNGIDKMGWHPGLAICLTGGIGPHFQPFLPQDKIDASVERVGTPLDGAIELAFEQRDPSHEFA
jgi:glucosamine kinase